MFTMIVLKQRKKAGNMKYVSMPLAVLLMYLENKNNPTKKTSKTPKMIVTFIVCSLRFSVRYPDWDNSFEGSMYAPMSYMEEVREDVSIILETDVGRVNAKASVQVLTGPKRDILQYNL